MLSRRSRRADVDFRGEVRSNAKLASVFRPGRPDFLEIARHWGDAVLNRLLVDREPLRPIVQDGLSLADGHAERRAALDPCHAEGSVDREWRHNARTACHNLQTNLPFRAKLLKNECDYEIGRAVGKGPRLDVPGVALGDDWMLVAMNAIGLGTLRHGVGKGR
jgi:hypothetical protein